MVPFAFTLGSADGTWSVPVFLKNQIRYPSLVIKDCTNPRYFAAGTSNAVKLSRFFDKVIEKRYFTRDSTQMTSFTDRKRFNFKSLHYD
ncbi:Rab-like protein 3 [Ameca splendens]|uniref:Rab-like protein 3 n=1 Tax=Ameca splendens TaxID=208324 RepID=A0ABV0XGC1_9TELE